METYALHLTKPEWTRIAQDSTATKPCELVLRSFDQDVEFAIGSGENAPDTEPVLVPAGEGRRLKGTYFYVRPTSPGQACRITHRGRAE